MAPFDPQRTYSHWLRKRPNTGRDASVLSHGTIPRQTQPPACMASEAVGAWRQSAKMQTTAPAFATRRHSESHSTVQYRNERWSRLSPRNSGRVTATPFETYFELVTPTRSPRKAPPDEY